VKGGKGSETEGRLKENNKERKGTDTRKNMYRE